jgi:hypothetical protein
MTKAEKERQKKLIDRQLEDAAFSNSNAACPTDCTGLAYRPPQNKYEEEAYEEIYHYLPPK